jgi:hypothetical protein
MLAPARGGSARGVDVASVTVTDMELAIGPNWRKYDTLWPEVREGCIRGQAAPIGSWSWAGFFFGGFWMLYRKQYSAFFVIMLLNLAIAFVIPAEGRALGFVVTLLVARYGKWWILRNATLMAARIRSLGSSDADTASNIRRQGGVNFVTALVGAVALIAVVGLVIAPAFIRGFEHGLKERAAAHASST